MFKIIPNTNGYYSCDENGNIKSNRRTIYNKAIKKHYEINERILKPYVTNKGYKVVDLRVNNKTKRWLVSRLVALTWIPNPNNYPVINHKDNNPLNNHIDNLEWCTISYNVQYSYDQGRHKPTDKYMKAAKRAKPYLWKSIIQYDLSGNQIKEYKSIYEAAQKLIDDKKSINKKSCVSNISTACRGKAKSAYGYKWKFKSDESVTTKLDT